MLAAFDRGGFDSASTVHAYRIVSSYLTGYLFGQLRSERSPSIDVYLEQLSSDDYPVLHELAAEITRVDRASEYELGLDLILEALEQYRRRLVGPDAES
jgi:hypothetical protein